MSLKRTAMMAAVGFLGLTLFAAPVIRLEPTSTALGNFPANIEQVREFTVFNDGDQPLLISKIKSTCGCAVGSVALSELKPGESTVVTAKIVPESIAGPFSKALYVHSNDPEKSIAAVTISGASVPLVTVLPQNFIHAGTLTVDQEWSQEFLLQVAEPVEWGDVVSSGNAKITVEPVKPEDDQTATTQYRLKVSWTPQAAAGSFRIAVHIPIVKPADWKPVELLIQGQVSTVKE